MRASYSAILERSGRFQGSGVNHEGQLFTGSLELDPLLGGKALNLSFRAHRNSGEIDHDERSTLGPTLSGTIALWVVSSNHPAVIEHEWRRTERGDGFERLVFGFGDVEHSQEFREEIALDLYDNGDVGYVYFWGMPGGEFKERSGCRMKPVR